ncbi:MAG: hypothetical protein H6601_05450, partial [Flavobacteriales bacterium]|nr:hypothetical protein [Flavobacteriales bacterium]
MKYSKLRIELGVNVIKGDSEELAILTHQLQSGAKTEFSVFEEEAIAYTKRLNGQVSRKSADAVQLKMPIEWDIPF